MRDTCIEGVMGGLEVKRWRALGLVGYMYRNIASQNGRMGEYGSMSLGKKKISVSPHMPNQQKSPTRLNQNFLANSTDCRYFTNRNHQTKMSPSKTLSKENPSAADMDRITYLQKE